MAFVDFAEKKFLLLFFPFSLTKLFCRLSFVFSFVLHMNPPSAITTFFLFSQLFLLRIRNDKEHGTEIQHFPFL